MLLYVQWTKTQHTAKLSQWMLKLNKTGYTATIVAVKKNNISQLPLWSQLWNCCRLRESQSQIGKYELRPWSQCYFMFSGLKHNVRQSCRNGC